VPRVAVADEDRLYRRIAPGWVKPDGTLASVAYMRSGRPDSEVSVDLARLTTTEQTLARAPRPGFGLGALAASLPRSLGLEVRHDPVEGNAAHAVIAGNASVENCRRLARATLLLVPPTPATP
jgi:hypothetical protein